MSKRHAMSNGRQLRAGRHRGWFAAAAFCLVLAACSNGSPGSVTPSQAGQYPGWPGSGLVVGNGDFIPIVVSSELATGHSRVLIALTDAAGRDLGGEDVTLEEAYYDLAGSTETPVSTVDGTFRWLIPDEKTIYSSYADFAHSGDWGVAVTAHQPGQPDRTARVTFSVRDTTATPAIGAAAPPSDTLTATDPAALVVISTDTNPDPAFYTLSVKDAIAAGKPFVLVFATPLFCTSGLCGPALDLVKQVAPDYIERVNFIHVEPYVLQVKDGRTQPELDVTGYPKSVRAAVEWGLPTEPWVFVVDAQGKVAAKFEGMAYPDELTAVLDALQP